MGVDCRVVLPGNVRVRDVANVVGVAAGLKPERCNFQGNTGWSTKVDGVEVSSTTVPELVNIVFGVRHCWFHFEGDGNTKLLSMKSTKFWIAVAKKVADFFGGYVDYNDCDSADVNYVVAFKDNDTNQPSDGNAWYDMQNRLLNLKPVSRYDMYAVTENAYNDDDGYKYTFDEDGYLVR